jgi:hypothetical protein
VIGSVGLVMIGAFPYITSYNHFDHQVAAADLSSAVE